jgi:hypothetical protein
MSLLQKVVMLVENADLFNSARLGASKTVSNISKLRLNLTSLMKIVLKERTCDARICLLNSNRVAENMYRRVNFTCCLTRAEATKAVLKNVRQPVGTLIWICNNVFKYNQLLASLPSGWNLEIYTFESHKMYVQDKPLRMPAVVRTLDSRLLEFMFVDRIDKHDDASRFYLHALGDEVYIPRKPCLASAYGPVRSPIAQQQTPFKPLLLDDFVPFFGF